ncbi:type I-G CRISPR-associated protein Csb2 [Desulfogranum mediterraneum]|uniref:type I-G CRISPR-associated protein Csb2 n=1 Tax=Desulfogranum mediterraneum TaxID=160661 RepID=UPI0003F769AF|nr:type I-U CRISPR-associated protein Csb2 [Desulfogranum mediterraneum]
MDVAVQIEFLVTPQLASPSGPRYGEWPPAPDRVFQALVATAAETGKDMGVLTCLESAPGIQASEATMYAAPVRFVPENYRRSNRYHQGARRYLPTVHPQSPVVTYVWSDVPADAVEPLREIVELITHIGRAASLARGTLVDAESVYISWIPDDQGEVLMRVPYQGRLNDLVESFNRGVKSTQAPVSGYSNTANIHPSTEWGDLMVLRPEYQLDLSRAPQWTDKMRRAVMSKASDDMPAFIHGHGDHRHVAWAAIPDVGHRFASGRILGLGCWVPSDVSLEERGLLGSLLMRVTELNGLKLEIDQVGLKGLRRSTWSRPSPIWSTVTPIALDRWPKKTFPPEMVVANSLSAMGLPKPERIMCSNHSQVKGAANARKYPSRRGNRFITHALIEWAEPIVGPLLIGADRYFGGGLCRPLS